MRRNLNEALLREYISTVLTEDEEGGAYIGQSAGGMLDIGTASDILDILGVKGVINAVGTVAGKTKELTTSLKTAANVLFRTALTSVIPFYGYDYADVFKKEETDLKKVKEEYKDIYGAVDEVFKDNDVAMFAFMANPALFIGSKMAAAAPGATKKMLSAVTGGKSDEIIGDVIEDLQDADKWLSGEDDKEREQRLKSKETKRKARAKGKDTSSPYSLFNGRSYEGGRLTEEDEGKKKFDLSDLLRNKKLITKIVDSSPELQDAMKKSVAIYRRTLQAAAAEAKKALDAVTYDSIIKNTKEKSPEFVEQVKAISGMGEAEKKAAQQQIVIGVRTELKKKFLEKLTKRADAAVKAGADENSQLVKDLAATIKKIQTM